jgi:protein involved in polysaccharide export with SLBB domain
MLTGCETNSFLDPSTVGRMEFTPTTVPILERLAAIEGTTGPGNVETSSVRPEDLIPEVEAYRVGPGDELEIRIPDYFQIDKEEVFPRTIDPRGFIDLPALGAIYLDGLTADDIRNQIRQAIVDKSILRDPIVQIQVLTRRRLTYSIMGAVNSPGLFNIPRPDYRLLDALTNGGRFSESVQHVYVIRQIPLSDKVTRGALGRPGANSAPGTAAPAPAGTPPTDTTAPAPTKPKDSVLDLIDELTKPADKPKAIMPESGPAPKAADKPAEKPKLSFRPAAGPALGYQPASTPPVDIPQDRPGQPSALQPVMPESKSPTKSTTATTNGAAPASAPAPAGAAAAQPAAAPQAQPATGSATGEAQGEDFWIFQDGQWIQVRQAKKPAVAPKTQDPIDPLQPAPPLPTTPPGPGPAGTPAPTPPVPGQPPVIPGGSPTPSVPGAEQLVTQRVIEVPVGPLLAGSAQFNIIIRPGDVIRVPAPAEGLVYLAGEVQRPGPYNLPQAGRLTLMRAINAAGGLNNQAIPERVDLIRMVGPDRQAMIRLNLRAIFEGTQPDVFLKSDDMINVGTNFFAFPLAVIRNGFRASYGFGFILDRNFQGDVFGLDRAQRAF